MIRNKLKKNIFSFNGVALIIGIVGGLFGIISPFITDWKVSINLKWFVGLILLFAILLFVLLKVCVDLSIDLKSKITNYAEITSYLPKAKTFLVKKNELFGYGAMVSILYIHNGYEVELGKGYVKNIQEKFMQVELLKIEDNFSGQFKEVLNDIENNNITVINKLIVKCFIKYE